MEFLNSPLVVSLLASLIIVIIGGIWSVFQNRIRRRKRIQLADRFIRAGNPREAVTLLHEEPVDIMRWESKSHLTNLIDSRNTLTLAHLAIAIQSSGCSDLALQATTTAIDLSRNSLKISIPIPIESKKIQETRIMLSFLLNYRGMLQKDNHDLIESESIYKQWLKDPCFSVKDMDYVAKLKMICECYYLDSHFQPNWMQKTTANASNLYAKKPTRQLHNFAYTLIFVIAAYSVYTLPLKFQHTTPSSSEQNNVSHSENSTATPPQLTLSEPPVIPNNSRTSSIRPTPEDSNVTIQNIDPLLQFDPIPGIISPCRVSIHFDNKFKLIFTTDGSLPQLKHPRFYHDPVDVERTTTFRMLLLYEGKPVSDIVEKTWIVQNKQRIGTSIQVKISNDAMMDFVWIPSGTFIMGAQPDYRDRPPREFPPHRVNITRGFWMSKTEVTQSQWISIMGNNPSRYSGKHRPVETVSTQQIDSFIERLNTMKIGQFRLPTEAEWEYACRAGTETEFYWGSQPDVAKSWNLTNSSNQTHPVGTKEPNPWGLYDMAGNVNEIVKDYFSVTYYSESPMDDPTGPNTGEWQVTRGGGWSMMMDCCGRVTGRSALTHASSHNGFRIVMRSNDDYQSP